LKTWKGGRRKCPVKKNKIQIINLWTRMGKEQMPDNIFKDLDWGKTMPFKS
jgi:hypothetical protein